NSAALPSASRNPPRYRTLHESTACLYRISLSCKRLHLKWERNVCEGAGLQNLGNTCFLNATLQCLTYTPPLANYLLLQEHSRTCCTDFGFPAVCYPSAGLPSASYNPFQNPFQMSVGEPLKGIAKHLRFGEQEDAHEFLRYMVDAMQLSCLYDHSEHKWHKQTCFQLVQTFNCGGGARILISHLAIIYEVKKCTFCCMKLDLPVANAYDGQVCCRLLPLCIGIIINLITAALSVQCWRECLPMLEWSWVLLASDITYPEHLDVQPFMSKSPGEPVIYILYSVLVHAGTDCDIGHYYCYNK
uniref:Ubiquitin carboxyl-terminal hydrolase 36 n=1 Tax=Petromyzon marinus TaxID=7757 RepID=S4RUH3_PETMA